MLARIAVLGLFGVFLVDKVWVPGYLQLLQRSQKLWHTGKVLQPLLAARPLAEAPQVRQHLVWNAASLIRDADDYMLGRFADQDLNGRRLRVLGLALLDDGLDRVAEQFAHNVLEVAEYVRKGGVEVAVDVNVWYVNVGAICAFDQLLSGFAAALHNLPRIAPQEDFTYRLGVWVIHGLGMGKVPRRVEGFGEGEMLLCNHSTGNALHTSEHAHANRSGRVVQLVPTAASCS